jgi:hypothetical protein
MIRHGAQLVYAYGQATVPRVCVSLRDLAPRCHRRRTNCIRKRLLRAFIESIRCS